MNAVIRITAMLMLVQSSGDPVQAADAIKIGVVNEITGVQAQAGEFTVNGIKLAQEEINNAGGVTRRAYLKGVGAQLGCAPPGAPEPNAGIRVQPG